jgi:DNA-directed RNA polymerase specialized sigma24 family protein
MSHNHATDTVLLDAIRIDDTNAFEELISRYWFCIYQYSYGKTRSQGTAAEITRNIFIELWEYRCYIPANFSIQVYLHERVRKKIAYYLYKKISEEPDNAELMGYLNAEFSFNNLKSAYRPVPLSPKTSIEKGSYSESNETRTTKIQREQNFTFYWRLLFNNIRLGVRNTFHF